MDDDISLGKQSTIPGVLRAKIAPSKTPSMKILLFNYKGIVRPDKKLALHRLISSDSLDIIFLQGTLGSADDITCTLEHSLPGWKFSRLDAQGRSGGLALDINSRSIKSINS